MSPSSSASPPTASSGSSSPRERDVVSAAVSGPPAAPSVAAPGGGGRQPDVEGQLAGRLSGSSAGGQRVPRESGRASRGVRPQDTAPCCVHAGAALQEDVPPVPAERGPVAASPSAACRRLSSQASCSPRSALDVRTVSRRPGSLSAQAVGKHGASLNRHETGVLRARRQPAGTGARLEGPQLCHGRQGLGLSSPKLPGHRTGRRSLCR